MILEYIKLSINELFNNKLRTFLSLIGIIIGVAVVYIILSLKDISRIAIIQQINGNSGIVNINYLKNKTDPFEVLQASYGSNYGDDTSGGSKSQPKGYKFTDEDVEELKKVENVIDSMLHYSASATVKFDRKSTSMTIKRNTKGFSDFYEFNITHGKSIEDFPESKHMNIAVISEKTATEILKTTEQGAIGKKLQIGSRLFTVVGVGKSTNNSLRNIVLIPQVAYDSIYSKATIQYISAKAKPGANLDMVADAVTQRMNEIHGTVNTKQGYAKEDLSQITQSITSVTDTLSIVMSIIASISLLVAGIGVMNIMLVSVVERTKEIGVKRALGASKYAVQFQFIVESSLLTLIGGTIGVLIGQAVIHVALILLKIKMPINFVYIGSALLFSVSLGMIFGYLPSKRAANLNIIEAIQSE